MPQAVVHVLVVIILLDIIRDFILKNKRSIPLSFIFIGGIAGLLPDIDIPFYWLFKNFLHLPVEWFHRTFTHSIFFPIIFLIIALIFVLLKNKRYSLLFSIITFGVVMHLVLDAIFAGQIRLFYPFSQLSFGLNLFSRGGLDAIAPGVDAILFLGWLFYIEWRHKISDFI